MARRGEDHEDDPIRKAAQYRVDREAAREAAADATEPGPAGTGRGVRDAGSSPDARDTRDGGDAGDEAGATDGVPGGPRRIRMDERSRYVDTVIDQAIRRGEFDNLPLQGKPIPSLKSGAHDPDWWLKNLVEREQITGVLPSAQLRKDDAELDEALDREVQEDRVREIVEDFNARVIDARRQLLGGPPVVTPTRDVDQEVARWRQRRAARAATRSRPDSAARPDRTAPSDRKARKARTDRTARTTDAGASPSPGGERPASDRRRNPEQQTTKDRTTGEKKPWWRPW